MLFDEQLVSAVAERARSAGQSSRRLRLSVRRRGGTAIVTSPPGDVQIGRRDAQCRAHPAAGEQCRSHDRFSTVAADPTASNEVAVTHVRK